MEAVLTRAIVGNCPCGEAALCMSVFASSAICLSCCVVCSAVCLDGEALLDPAELFDYLACDVGVDGGWSGRC